MTATTLKPQAMDSTTRLASKVIAFTRDASAASGDVAYTGVGFVPTSIIAVAGIEGTVPLCIGGADSAKAGKTVEQYYGGLVTKYDYLIGLDVSSGNQQRAIVSTFDSDGFTLTWTKTGSPTGTINGFFLCFR